MENYKTIIAERAKKIDAIKGSKLYQKIMSESFGGIIYNMANLEKYRADPEYGELVAMWQALTPDEQMAADGIVKGALNFIEEGK